MLKLNDAQIELLKKVKEQMLDDGVRGTQERRSYICWNVWLVSKDLQDMPVDTTFGSLVENETSDDVRNLIEAIEGSLDGFLTFTSWLDNSVGDKVHWPAQNVGYTLGRLAWLDRMIDTGEVA